MEIRKTTVEDLAIVMDIYDHARQYMRQNGNLTQWTEGYPSVEIITSDINQGNSYVCIAEKSIIGVFSFIPGIDPTYLKIYEGSWLNEEPYGVIHRIAVASHQKGAATFCIDWCFRQCHNIRIDTHEDNSIMQRLLLKNGFDKCGTIYLANGAPRVAFQKIDHI